MCLCQCVDQRGVVGQGLCMGKYCLVVEKRQIGVEGWIQDRHLLNQMCTGMGRSSLDIDCRAGCQEQPSIHEILAVLVVNHRYMFSEVVRTHVADHMEIQAVTAESAAGTIRKNLFETVWAVAAAVLSMHRRSTVHKNFAETSNSAQYTGLDMVAQRQCQAAVKLTELPLEP